ncbi:MAG TPA: phosphoribosylamine--glycine ligase [Methanocorpusculum sp.]|nr:phosphoribosylamine--glycine ligase [Methanocorpusculum sp.]HJJ40176.1 phosphoribosylamine--glycine ligase [Methanocorpusculum sp.]HJJ49565.1 phosphoribosylamine--glycine ligase [Methanocorpusculum sp.]HJJ57650.1 phosphoribosylamine--glycine ligase [Methanocorpusculum sp.]HJJ95166.1 phosphoribosylamine--glycine ligase [Methanocorpusculum sp.]
MKILVVGGGGREHAITSALVRNTSAELYSVMGKKNPGIAKLSREVFVHAETDVATVISFAKEKQIELAVIGPEAPLEVGLSDALWDAGIPTVGPRQKAARIETDKGFCRNLMHKHQIPGCPTYKICKTPKEAAEYIEKYPGDLAVKPTGLTGGKGVKVMGEQVDRAGAIEYAMTLKDQDIILEERLLGEEFTLMAFVDGKTLVPMPLVQDHKRAYEGDVGPNTGGMGSYSLETHKFPFVTSTDYAAAFEIMQKTVAALADEGCPYQGILYGQFMNTRDGPKVIEFNARFGDPEAMNVLSLLDSDFTVIADHITKGTLSPEDVSFKPYASVCKYLVPEGYPENSHAGDSITLGPMDGTLLYYANVIEENGVLKTLTSRTMAFVGIGKSLAEAEALAESACRHVKGNVRYRSDIGTAQLFGRRIAHMNDLRK